MTQFQIREGFSGQKMWVIPRSILTQWAAHPMLQSLIPTDIGWYPVAKYHYRERENGADEHILIFCVAGAGWYEIDGQRYTVEANEALFIPRGVPHIYGADEVAPWSIHWVHFIGVEADFFLYHLPTGEQKLHVDPGSASAIEHLFTECYDSFIGGFVLYRLIYCTQILRHLLGYLFFNNNSFSPTQRTSSLRSLEATLTFLHQNIQRDVTLGEMANHAGLSISHFSFLFKQQTGYSPIDYFIHLKMQRACALLSLSHNTIQEIAYEVGYDDPYYFSRIFKKIMGISPRHYRQTNPG
ncbi:MAG TPA: AraC family transcriptional regulator [Phototrophicaceae bacterium]|jgi:AraC-like DNA-binding protein|nr:AraC family transcriptional regulator [Phototrophicaceae bacterium]